MEPSTNSSDDTPDYLCGICPRRFPLVSLVRHIINSHVNTTDENHAHSLWCRLCSPILNPLNGSANNDHSNHHEDFGPRSGTRNDSISVNWNNSNLVHGQHPFIFNVSSVYISMYHENGEVFFNYWLPAMSWDETYYNGTDILSSFNGNMYTYATVQHNSSTLNGQFYNTELTNNSWFNPRTLHTGPAGAIRPFGQNGSNPSINLPPFPTKAEDMTLRLCFSKIDNAEISFSGDATYIQLPKTASSEINREGNVAYVEPLPETANAEISCSGQLAYTEPLLETANAEITCSGQSTHIESLPVTANAEIPCSGQSVYTEPVTVNAEIPCSGQSAYMEPLPEAPNAEILGSGQSTYIEPLTETAHSEMYCSGQSKFVEFRPQATDSEFHLSESSDDKFRVDVCHSSCRHKGLNDGSSTDTLNISGPKASIANSHGSGSDKTLENSIISGASLKDSKRNSSYSEALKRGLRKRH